MTLHHVQMGLVTGSRWSGSDRSPPGIFFLGRAGETGEQVITLITLRNLRPGKLPLARDGSCRTKLCNPCPLSTHGVLCFSPPNCQTEVSCIDINTSSPSSLLFLSPFPKRRRVVRPCFFFIFIFTRTPDVLPGAFERQLAALCPFYEVSLRRVCCFASASGVRFCFSICRVDNPDR